jgi:hypothetical protein
MLSQEEGMLTATDPMDMTPEDRRRETAAILAAGFLRARCRPSRPIADGGLNGDGHREIPRMRWE